MKPRAFTPKELYRLRKLRLEAERQALLAQLRQNWLQAFLLELEYKYDLLGTKTQLDIVTGQIAPQEEIDEPVGHESAPAPRPA